MLRKCQSVTTARPCGVRQEVLTEQQRSRASSPAHTRALRANGMTTRTTAFQFAKVSGLSQLARRWCAMPSPHASTRLRLVLDQP